MEAIRDLRMRSEAKERFGSDFLPRVPLRTQTLHGETMAGEERAHTGEEPAVAHFETPHTRREQHRKNMPIGSFGNAIIAEYPQRLRSRSLLMGTYGKRERKHFLCENRWGELLLYNSIQDRAEINT